MPARPALAATLAAATLLAACGSSGGGSGGGGPAGAGVTVSPSYGTASGRFQLGTTLPAGIAGKPAPAIRLTDARGGMLDTATLTGKPYLVTFLYANCPDVCPLIGEEIRAALGRLGADAQRVAVVAVSVDPRGDTAENVRAWLTRHREPAQFHYLIGTQAALQPVWKAWYAAPQIPGDPESAHTAVVWLVDAKGRLATKVDAGQPFDPAGLAHDMRVLLAS